EILDSITAQLNYLMTDLKGRGNWYIAQADAMLFTSLRFAFLPDAAAWQTRGVKILNEAFRRQVLPDGAHIECNPSYHAGMRLAFEVFWRLGRGIPSLGLRMEAGAIARMWQYTLASHRPSG